MTLHELQRQVVLRVQLGHTLERIDAELIAGSALSEDEQAAAWILARAQINAREIGRARWIARQASVFNAAATSEPPRGSD